MHQLRVIVFLLFIILLFGGCQRAGWPSSSPGVTVSDPNRPITVVGWNTEFNDADLVTISGRMADFEEVDLWGLSEVSEESDQAPLEQAAETGEGVDYQSVLGTTGGEDRLLAIFNSARFTLVEWWEEHAINTTGTARAPLVLHLRDTFSGKEFLFMVNHLYRSRDEERHKQAALLNRWAAQQTLGVIAIGDYNFDWSVTGESYDLGYELLTDEGHFTWVQPQTLVTTQCSGWPCQYNSVLDFVFVAGTAQAWRAEATIIVTPNDFPDSAATSDHRPVLARFWPNQARPQPTPVPARNGSVIIEHIEYDGQVPLVESDEYVVIANMGGAAVDLTGWQLNDESAGEPFVFPATVLAPGARMRVYTNEIHLATGGFSFGQTQAIWRNQGECGDLTDAAGREVNQYCY